MRFVVVDSMLPDGSPFFFGECDAADRISRLAGYADNSWNAIAVRDGAPSTVQELARVNARFTVVFDDVAPEPGREVVDLIGGSSDLRPGDPPALPRFPRRFTSGNSPRPNPRRKVIRSSEAPRSRRRTNPADETAAD